MMANGKGIDIAKGGPLAPCRQDCSKRSAECHGICEAYLKYERDREAYRIARANEKAGLPRCTPYMMKSKKEKQMRHRFAKCPGKIFYERS